MRKLLVALIIAAVIIISLLVVLPTEKCEIIAKVSSPSGIVIEIKKFENSRLSILAYWQKEPNICLEVRGLGGDDYRFFDHVREITVYEDESWVVVRLKGERSGYWNFSAEVRLSKEAPGSSTLI